ncbi:MAG: hypothetical protein ACE5IL_03690 [Myxococcota bacterium]
MRGLPWLLLGLATAAGIQWVAPRMPVGAGSLEILLTAVSLVATPLALGWLAWLGTQRSTGWAIAWGAGLLVPYVNLVLVSLFARRYWREGARAPVLLLVGASVGETWVLLRLLSPPLPFVV